VPPPSTGGSDELGRRIRALSPAQLAALEASLLDVGPAVPVERIGRWRGDGPAPLSFAQQRLWFLDRLEPGSPFYNVATGARFPGRLDVGALERALGEIVRRHEVLRTTFAWRDREPVQVVSPDAEVVLGRVDVGDAPAADRERRVAEVAAREVGAPFDLARGPLLRALLVRVAEDDHVLLVTMHHIVSDGWSTGLFLRELGVLYAAFSTGRPPGLPELPIQYGDYTVWQRGWLSGERLERHLAYWRERLAGAPSVLELPADRPRPAVQSFRGAMHGFGLPVALADRLRALAREEESTLFMALLAAWATLLHRYSGEDDIMVGAPIANRTRPECQELIGFFVNTLALRVDLGGNPSFRELLRRVREVTLGAYEYQDLPFEKLIEEMDPERSLSHNPLFQVMFVLQNLPTTDGQAGEHPASSGNGTSKFDLTLAMAEGEGGLAVHLEYNTDLFDVERIVRMAGHLETLLAGIAADPDAPLSELPLLTAAERRQVLDDWNQTQAPYPEGSCVHELFEAQAQRTPKAPAVLWGQDRLDYETLDARANQLAHHLQSRGIGTESRVGVLMERSPELVVAFLAVLKAGAVYTPLDPQYPNDRLAFMLADAQVPLLLTQERLAGSLPNSDAEVLQLDRDWPTVARLPTTRPPRRAHPNNAAYLLYTSGSTGKPKGVLMPHRPLANHMAWMAERWPLAGTDAVLQRSLPSFDASLWELLAPLLAGARLVLAPACHRTDAPLVVDAVRDHDVTVLQVVPSLLDMLADEPRLSDCRTLRRVFVGGEALTTDVAGRFSGLVGAELHNLYGVTEGCIDSTWHAWGDSAGGSVVPIGRPIANVRVYLLDRWLQPVPVGVSGELYVGGVCVARGYVNRPELTAERFVPDPFGDQPGARMYRTGDLARYRSDGTIEYLGRLDHQVKLRGFRIELGEVEAVLGQHPGVQVAVCAVHDHGPGDRRLVAYVVPAAGEMPAAGELRGFLAQSLPEHMLPGAFVAMDALPLSPNGKVDRRALPAPDGKRPELAAPYVAPRTATERALAEIWAGILGVERVGVEDNFFDLGGHSLLATQVMAATTDAFDVEVPLRRLFEQPTVADQAAALVEVAGDEVAIEKNADLILTIAGLTEQEVGAMLNTRNGDG
jgi:amino acid adenylation domain-containing protein